MSNEIKNKDELKTYLNLLKSSLENKETSPAQIMVALNQVLSIPKIYDLLNKENKILAQEIWIELQKFGNKVKNPPILFNE